MKLALREQEEKALRAEMAEWEGYVSSALLGLEAIRVAHLATAVSIREEIGAFITYDWRLAQAAQASGLPVVTPGAVAGGNAPGG